MLHGDISNRVAPTIAIRVEDFLVEYKDEGIKDKVLNFIVGKERRATLNPKVVRALYHIFKHTDMCVDLIVHEDNLNEDLIKLISDLPFNQLKTFRKDISIAIDLNAGIIDYYVDDNAERRSKIGHKNCIGLNDLYLLIR